MSLHTDRLAAMAQPAMTRQPHERQHEAPEVTFAQQIAVYYPYQALATTRSDELLRSETPRGPAAASRYPGSAQRRHGRESG